MALSELYNCRNDNIGFSLSLHIFPLGDFIDDPTNSKINLESSSNKLFVHFAKNKKFGTDLYSEFVAPTLKSNLLAETWIRGHAIGPSCDGYSVEDITKTRIGNKYMFKNTKDHSKFAISKPGSENHYVCIGDINRMVCSVL